MSALFTDDKCQHSFTDDKCQHLTDDKCQHLEQMDIFVLMLNIRERLLDCWVFEMLMYAWWCKLVFCASTNTVTYFYLTRFAIQGFVVNIDDNSLKYTYFQRVIVRNDDSESSISLVEVNPDVCKILHPQIWGTIYILSTFDFSFQLPIYQDFANRQHSVRIIYLNFPGKRNKSRFL